MLTGRWWSQSGKRWRKRVPALQQLLPLLSQGEEQSQLGKVRKQIADKWRRNSLSQALLNLFLFGHFSLGFSLAFSFVLFFVVVVVVVVQTLSFSFLGKCKLPQGES